MERFLVTGATGFLGRAIVKTLAAQSCTIRCAGRSTAAAQYLPDFRTVDLAQEDDLTWLTSDVTHVIHAAGLAHRFHPPANTRQSYESINRDATKRLAEAAARKGCRHFVLISSVSVYGPQPDSHPTVARRSVPQGDYARSKWEAEQSLVRIAQRTGLKTTILRLGTLYGEGDPGNVGRLIRAIHRGRFVWIGRGDNQKNLLHRDDAARACCLAAHAAGKEVPTVHDVVGDVITTRQLVESIAKALGRRVPRFVIPSSVVRAPLGVLSAVTPFWSRPRSWRDTVDKWLRSDVLPNQAFRQQFGFAPHVSLEEGIERQVASYLGKPKVSESALGRAA